MAVVSSKGVALPPAVSSPSSPLVTLRGWPVHAVDLPFEPDGVLLFCCVHRQISVTIGQSQQHRYLVTLSLPAGYPRTRILLAPQRSCLKCRPHLSMRKHSDRPQTLSFPPPPSSLLPLLTKISVKSTGKGELFTASVLHFHLRCKMSFVCQLDLQRCHLFVRIHHLFPQITSQPQPAPTPDPAPPAPAPAPAPLLPPLAPLPLPYHLFFLVLLTTLTLLHHGHTR